MLYNHSREVAFYLLFIIFIAFIINYRLQVPLILACSILSAGDVELTNMQLKPEALNALKLPIKVKAGFLGSVKLKVGSHSI